MAFRTDFPSTARTDPSPFLATRASRSIETIVEAGAALLIAEPWRVGRIVRGAESLTLTELRNEAARRRSFGAPADFNRSLAFAQLARALERQAFATAWTKWRARERTDRDRTR